MGTLTGAQIELQVRNILPEASGDRVTSAWILNDTNSSYLSFCSKYDFSELDATDTEATVASTATTAFSATDVLFIKGIVDNNGIPLKEITANEYDRLLARTGAITGVPTHWYRTGSTTSGQVTVRWYPVPNTAYTMTLNYRKRPTALTISTATAIDQAFDEALVYATVARVAARVRLLDDSIKYKKYSDALMNDMLGSQLRGSEYQWSITENIMEEMS